MPLNISVHAVTDETDYAKEIKLTVSYDKSNESQSVQFYNSKFSSGVISTVKQTYVSKHAGDIYTITWDGRDDLDNRLAIGGKYNLNVEYLLIYDHMISYFRKEILYGHGFFLWLNRIFLSYKFYDYPAVWK